jgi:putative transposase
MTTANQTANHAGADVGVERLCRRAGIARSSYYRGLEDRGPREADTELLVDIETLCLRYRFYGYRRITAQLRCQCMIVNAKRVQSLMREDNLSALLRKPFIPPSAGNRYNVLIVPNLLRGLKPSAPDQIWVADITYVHLREAFTYLAVVLDAFTRKVIGWAFEDHVDAALAVAALDQAIMDRCPIPNSIIHHSDPRLREDCVQYASAENRQRLDVHAIQSSMSRPANPYDNARAESFMKTLKTEEVNGKAFKDIDHARSEIGHFIDTVYNTARMENWRFVVRCWRAHIPSAIWPAVNPCVVPI